MNIIKNIIQIIREEVVALSPRTRMYIVLGVCGLGVSVFGYQVYLSSAQFARDYEVYSFLAKTQQNDAFIPGAEDNPIRKQINQLLSDVLTNKMSAQERLSLVKNGENFLKEADKQIDAITISTDAANTAIAKMQVDTLGAFAISQNARELLALAKRRSAIITDIRAYSYRANFDIREIFNRIIRDDGKLSDDYVRELNDAAPATEEQFNKRTNLYTELQKLGEEMDKRAARL